MRNIIGRLEKLTGSRILAYQHIEGGYTPAVRLRCQTATTSFFAKIGVTPATSSYLRREIRVYAHLQGEFLPKLIAWDDQEQEPILVIEDLSGYHWPPPWAPRQIDMVLAQIDALHNTPAMIDPYAEVHGNGGGNWHTVEVDPGPFLALGMTTKKWLGAALPLLLENTNECQTEGNSLTHWDLRSDNICIGEKTVRFVDWNLACLSNPRLDLGFFLPSLAYEGGPEPESILPDAPEVAAWVAGFFAARAGLPIIPDAPYVRRVQRQQLETALPWAVRELGLPPLDWKEAG
jgi:hypothetical protein